MAATKMPILGSPSDCHYLALLKNFVNNLFTKIVLIKQTSNGPFSSLEDVKKWEEKAI